MTKVMQIVFCFPFPSTPNWHCRIEEEKLSPLPFCDPSAQSRGRFGSRDKRKEETDSILFLSD